MANITTTNPREYLAVKNDRYLWLDRGTKVYIYAAFLLDARLLFNPKADADFENLLLRGDREFAVELRFLISKKLTELAMYSSGGFRPKAKEQTIRHLYSLVDGYVTKKEAILQELSQAFVKKWFSPYSGSALNYEPIIGVVSAIITMRTVCLPLIEKPPMPYRHQVVGTNGLPSPSFTALIFKLTQDCGWVDPTVWQCITIPEVYSKLGFSRNQARIQKGEMRNNLENHQFKPIIKLSILRRHTYIWIRRRLDGLTERQLQIELIDAMPDMPASSRVLWRQNISHRELADYDRVLSYKRTLGRPKFSISPTL